MIYWEYSRKAIDGVGGNAEAQMNNMGREGWELVGIYDGYGVYKRPSRKKPEKKNLISYYTD